MNLSSRGHLWTEKLSLALLFCSIFVGLTIVPPALAEDTNLSQGDEARVKELVREYILENPEIIAEAITLLQARQETARTERQQEKLAQLQSDLTAPPEDTVIGNPDGSVTVVEFFDYNCGYCKSMFTTVLETMQKNDEIRLVLIEFPILGPNSVTASKAALASRKQGLYGPFHQALMNHKGGLSESTVMTLARGVGLNVDQLKADMKDPEIDDIIEKNRSLAQELEISGTPAFVVGNTLVPGALPPAQFEQLIEQAADSPS